MQLLKRTAVLLAILFFANWKDLPAQEPEIEVGVIEQLDTYIPRDIQLISETGERVELGSLLGKPTVLSLVYYRCPGICSPLMDGLATVIEKSGLSLGDDYQVITVSFDPREGPELAMRKKKNYFNVLELDEMEEGWNFYVTDSANSARLTQSVGFYYQAVGNDFTHTGTLIFISPQGKITRYLNGTRFLPFEFKMAVVESSKGQSGPTINKVLQYCYSYDPEGQQYVLNITRVAGIIITSILMLLFISLVLRSVIKKIKHNPA
jgi:protein SCO1